MQDSRGGGGVRAMRFGDDDWRTDPEYTIDVEPCGKRIRAEFAGKTVVDTTAALILREQRHTPVYYFPEGDIRTEFLAESTHSTVCPHKGAACYWTLQVGDRAAENAAWTYPNPFSHLAILRGHIAFYWQSMDRWLEEEEEVFVHPRDPRVRIDILDSVRRIEIEIGGTVIADSTSAAMLFEADLPTRFYFPPDDVRMDLLTPSTASSSCPYKGNAVYWSAETTGKSWSDIAWSYPDPVPECARIQNMICLFNERVDAIRVDGRVQSVPKTKWSPKEN